MKFRASLAILAFAVAVLSPCLEAQDNNGGKSLAEAARENQLRKVPRATKVYTDENMEAQKGPIPNLQLKGADNSEEIINAIVHYRSTHTSQETEELVRGWYSDNDNRMDLAIRDNQRMNEVHGIRNTNMPTDLPADGDKLKDRAVAEYRAVVSDAYVYKENEILITRIQQAFERVRGALRLKGMKYDWMKIRFANGNGSY